MTERDSAMIIAAEAAQTELLAALDVWDRSDNDIAFALDTMDAAELANLGAALWARYAAGADHNYLIQADEVLQRAVTVCHHADTSSRVAILMNAAVARLELGDSQQAYALANRAEADLLFGFGRTAATLPRIARALSIRVRALQTTGRTWEASLDAERLVELWRSLSNEDPRYSGELAQALVLLGSLVHQLERGKWPIDDPTEEAVRILERSPLADPASRVRLATAWTNVANHRLMRANRIGSREACGQAISTIAGVEEQNPHRVATIKQTILQVEDLLDKLSELSTEEARSSLKCAVCGRPMALEATYCADCGAQPGLPAAAPREDRRLVTVLFVDMVGFTPFAEQLDPEQVRTTQHEFFGIVRRIVRQYGGVVEKYIGDAVMAIFGAPVATENDQLRAVRAGLEIQRALDRQAAAVANRSFRIGIASGQALVNLDAARGGGQAIVAGDVVVTSARLQGVCPPGGVLVDQLTFEATRDDIEYAQQPPAMLKGKRQPSMVWLATAVRRLRLGERDESTPMVGRDHERGILTTALHRMIAERAPQLVTIFGTAGIGKSRLLRELSRYAGRLPRHDVRWLVGHCPPFGENVTWAALVEIVKSEVGILDTDDDATARARLSERLRRLAGAAEAERLADAMASLLGLAGSRLPPAEAESAWRRFLLLLADSGPTVLVFEDMHWADEAMLRFVEMLCGAGNGLPLMVIATARPELRESRPGWTGAITNAVSISLGPMPDSDISTMYAQMFGETGQAAASLEPLVELAGGNPLYAHEYVRMLVDRGELRPVGATWTLDADQFTPMPQTVQAVIANRLDLLEPTDRVVLQAAAVIGNQFWPGAIGAVSGLSHQVVTRALHRLQQRDLVVENATSTMAGEHEYAFRHILVRDVCYQRLPRSERVAFHQRTADWLEATTEGRPHDMGEVLANHRWAAYEIARTLGLDPSPYAPAARVSLHLAARRAYALHALDTAQTLVTRALSLKLDPDPMLDLFAAELAFYRDSDAFMASGGIDRLIELAAELTEAGEIASAARAYTLLGQTAWSRADRAETLHWLGLAARHFEDLPDSPEKVEALLELARTWMIDYEFGLTTEAAQAAAEAASRLHLAEAQASARITMATARFMSGQAADLAELIAVTDDCRRSQLSSWRRAAGNLAWGYLEEGDVASSLGLLDEIRGVVRTGVRSFLDSYNDQAEYAYMSGDWSRVIAATTAVMRRPTEEWDLHAIAIGAWMRVLRGETMDSGQDDPIETVLIAARRSGFHRVLRSAYAHSALCRALQGRTDEARSLLDELERDWTQTEMIGFAEWVAATGHTAALLGPEAAAQAKAMFLRSKRRTPWVAAALEMTSGALAEDAAVAAGHYLTAADHYVAIGTPSDVALALAAALRTLPAGDDRFDDVSARVRHFAERFAAPLLFGPVPGTAH